MWGRGHSFYKYVSCYYVAGTTLSQQVRQTPTFMTNFLFNYNSVTLMQEMHRAKTDHKKESLSS